MRIYIMTDQEGVAGVLDSANHAAPGDRYYERARELTTLEVNAAIEGAMQAGATEFLVVDGHGYGSIDPVRLRPQAKLLAGRPLQYPFCCDDTFDAAFIVGQHAKSNADGGHLAHTGSFAQEDLLINGLSVGEIGCNLLMAAYYGVPTILLTGDLAACEEAASLVPEIETAAVKEGVKRGSASGLTADENRAFNGAAIHLHPEEARRKIAAAAQRAVARADSIRPFWIEPPYELVSILRPAGPGEPRRVAMNRSNDLIELLNMPRHHKLETELAG